VTSIRDQDLRDIGGVHAVHLSELSWERTPKGPQEMFKVGDEVPVYVLKVDQESKKFALSVLRAQALGGDILATAKPDGARPDHEACAVRRVRAA
jgi:ribosomal protein S1